MAPERALSEARTRLDNGDLAGARAAVEEARAALPSGEEGADEIRAAAVVVEASVAAFDDAPVDRGSMEWAGGVLAGKARWEDAMNAYLFLAGDVQTRGDTRSERQWLAAALGCAEATGSVIYAPRILRRLALIDLADGNADGAGVLASRALARLDPARLLAARLAEAECLETLGDAWAARGDLEQAASCWRDASERLDRLDRGKAAEALRAKVATVSR